MFSQLIHHTSAILRRSHPFKPWPPPLHVLRLYPNSRAHSWSGQSESANWNHLNDLYGRLASNKPRELPMSADERWAMQSRIKTGSLMPPKGPYAGNVVLLLETHEFLMYQFRKECRSEKRKRCRGTEQATVHLTEEQDCLRTQANCSARKERL